MPADLVVRAARLLPAVDAETFTDGAPAVLHRPVQVIARGRAYECAIASKVDRAGQRAAAQHIHDELTVGSGRDR